ncbi:cytochrome P450 26A1-like [Gigantopelta aegis]|uniref:cytochrome P450 26A1-like n=1 Tax=Gigantopelta aegis TaxID=1735272 RepID=UPI001B8894D4|nr:cytochrome P450 26A1-like [Gigantopelta aegis]
MDDAFNAESSQFDHLDNISSDWLQWCCFYKTCSLIFQLFLSWLMWCLTKYLWRMYFLRMRDVDSALPLPPGEMGYPIIGETLQFFRQGADFYNRRIAKYGRVFKTHLLGSPTVRVIGSENVRKILLGEHIIVDMKIPRSASLLFGSGAIVNSSGDHHRLRKKSLQKAFNPEFLSSCIPNIRRLVRKWCEDLCNEGEVLGFERCKVLMTTISAEVLLGFNMEDVGRIEELMTQFENITNAVFTFPWQIPGTSFAKAMKSRAILVKDIKQRLQKEASSQSEDVSMTDVLRSLDTEDDSSTADDLADSLLEMWLAGHLTQSSAACSLILCVGRDDGVRNNIEMELERHHLIGSDEDVDLTYNGINQLIYTSNVVKEVLRLYPPAGGGFRQTKSTIEVGGYQIPKGWTVIYSIRDTHQTTDLFTDPQDFRPERWQHVDIDQDLSQRFNYIPFSAGARRCLGEKFANLVLKLFLIEVVGYYNWTLRNKNPSMRYLPSTHPVDKLPVSFSRKVPHHMK